MGIKVDKLLNRVNSKDWWHVTPQDPDAYEKRGKFLASTYREAEFWGRPNDVPERVRVAAPLVGDELTIERRLFGKQIAKANISVKQRFALDGRIRRAAIAMGFDSIVLMSNTSYARYRKEGRIPLSLELNVLDLRRISAPNGTSRSARKTQ
jgi:hypothetical protein